MNLINNKNKKIGKHTLVLNITSATDCMSHKLGLCQIPTNCYAIRPERRWKDTLPFRRRQTELWDNFSIPCLAKLIRDIIKRKRTEIKYIRFSECGDFRDQADVDKLFEVAKLVPLPFYGYTARKDLDFSKAPDNVIINGSGFMIHNSFTVVPKKEIENYNVVCKGKCELCGQCRVKSFAEIKIAMH